MSGWKAIPTTYNGRVYRSRLESNVALMLDQLGIEFEHEPSSFLLDDGTHYMPDFWCPKIRLWIEVRGYSTPKADRQIELFGQAIMDGRLDENKMMQAAQPDSDDEPAWRGRTSVDYMVLSPNRVSRFFEEPSWHTCSGDDNEIIVCLCQCDQVYFASNSNDWQCRSCGKGDKRYHLKDWQEFFLDEVGIPTVESHKYDRTDKQWKFDTLAVSSWIERERKRVAPTFTPARGSQALWDHDRLIRRWPAMREYIWKTPIERATFHTAQLVGVEGSTLIVKMERGNLLLLKEERKQEVREKIRELLGETADVRFIDDTSSYGK